MRLLLVLCVAVGATSAASPSLAWSVNASSFALPVQSLTTSPNGESYVYGGDENIAVGNVLSGSWVWNESYVDIQAQIQGPYAFADNKVFAGAAPNSGTIATLWGVDTANGNMTWNIYDDASLDQLYFAGGGGAFYAGCVTTFAVVKVWGVNGTKAWKADLGDFIFGIVVSVPHNVVFVAYGAAATALSTVTGRVVWNHTQLSTQIQGVAYDEQSSCVVFVGGADPNGNVLDYSTVYVFDALSGSALWAKNFTSLNTTMVASGGVVLLAASVSASNSIVFAVDLKSGSTLWKRSAPPTVSTSLPAVSKGAKSGSFLISSTLNDITTVDSKSGKDLATFSIPSSFGVVAASPVPTAGGITVVATQTTTEAFVIGLKGI